MSELTTLNVILLRTMVCLAIVAEPVKEPDTHFSCVRLGIVSRHWEVNPFHWTILALTHKTKRHGGIQKWKSKEVAHSLPASSFAAATADKEDRRNMRSVRSDERKENGDQTKRITAIEQRAN